MGLYISEHSNIYNFRQIPIGAPLARYYLSSTTAAGPFPRAGAKFVRVSADAGGYFNNSTTSTGLTLTSTNSFRIAPNLDAEIFAISTSNRIQTAST